MKVSEFNNLNIEDLNKQLISLLHKQFILRIQFSSQQLSNTNLLRENKKDIARIKTLLTQKKHYV